ncbi:MAG: hypothetical protein R2879_14435 [Saprospiraceae bacterium]
MTLEEFFNWLSAHPFWIMAFFVFLPLTAFLAWKMGAGEARQKPWIQMYAILIYLTCIPGIFSITLSLYLFLFENVSILQTNIFTQVLPVVSMFATLFLIQKNIAFENIPGFEKLSGLIFLIAAILVILWIVDRTRIWMIMRLPIYLAFLIFAGLLILGRIGWSKLSR